MKPFAIKLSQVFLFVSLNLFLLRSPRAMDIGDAYYNCVTQALPSLQADENVRRLLIDSMDCVGQELSLYSGVAGVALGNQQQICQAHDLLTTECRKFVELCGRKKETCRMLMHVLYECFPYLEQEDMILSHAGIKDSQHLAEALIQLDHYFMGCEEGREYIKPEVPLFWEQHCDDYKEQPLSFWELNDSYYELDYKKSAIGEMTRALLLRRFAESPASPEKWQRIVASIMALESLNLSDDPDERASAARVLGRHGDFSAAVKFSLLEKLTDVSPLVRAEAAFALRTQGDRTPLIVFALLSKLLNPSEDYRVRGNAALALREQSVSYECERNEEAIYKMDGSEDPEDLENGVPLCSGPSTIPMDEQEGDYFSSMLSGKERCPKLDPQAVANVFDKYTSAEQLKDFDIIKNLCYYKVQMRLSKILTVVQPAMIMAIQNENHLSAKVKMISALRNIGIPTANGQLALTMLRNFLNDPNYRIRRAAIYALAKVGKSESWLLETELPRMLCDPSPSVRKAAIAAVTEIVLPTLSEKVDVYQSYINGMNLYRSLNLKDCADVSKLLISQCQTSFDPAKRMFIEAGFYTEKNIMKGEVCKAEDSSLPILNFSRPERGARDIDPALKEIVLKFSNYIEKDHLQRKTILVNNNLQIPLELLEYHASDEAPLPYTYAKFIIKGELKFNEYYQIKLLEGLKTNSQGKGYKADVNILFYTKSIKIGDQLATLVSMDDDIDVQYTAAEAFLAKEEAFVLEFLRAKLFMKPARNMSRAAHFLSSPYLSYQKIASLNEEDRLEFIESIIKQCKAYIEEHEHMFQSVSLSSKSYLELPVLIDFYRLIATLVSKPWVTKEMKLKLDRHLNLQPWIMQKLKADFPLREYSYYERMYYPNIRKVLKDLMDNHFMQKDALKKINVDYLIYENIVQNEAED